MNNFQALISHSNIIFIYSDVNFLTQTAPPAAAEWQSLLRPLRGREPEGMWNLLSLAREMFRRGDSNAIPTMEIVTDEVLQCEQVCGKFLHVVNTQDMF